jgi:hypothetical protein
VKQSVQGAVRSYRFYFFDTDNHIAKAQEVELSTDVEAGELAVLMLAEQSGYPSIEVWDRARRVHRLP